MLAIDDNGNAGIWKSAQLHPLTCEHSNQSAVAAIITRQEKTAVRWASRFFMDVQTLWRGSLLPLGCEATPKPITGFLLTCRIGRFYDCFAAEREQAPSPQKLFTSVLIAECSATRSTIESGTKAHKPADSGVVVGRGARRCSLAPSLKEVSVL